MYIGSRVIVHSGRLDFVGQTGTVVAVTGDHGPFHWVVRLDSGPELCWRGDELAAA